MISVSSNFDGGNIDVVDCSSADNIRLNIRKDNQSDFYQWFYFRLTGAVGQVCTMRLENADKSAYAQGWAGYEAVASYDREFWFRVPTRYEGGHLIIEHEPEANAVYYAYFAPYSMERHADLIADCLQSRLVAYEHLGHTLDGQDMDILHVAEEHDRVGEDLLTFWVIARQHPGETMAEWWMEGFLGRLLDEDDPVSRALLTKVVFHIVPNMNPDGSRRGNLRTNAAGANLNREWKEPTMERSPEVFLVRKRMHDLGVDFAMDVHGDEALPHNFIAGAEGIPGWTERLANLQEQFKNALVQASPDFQTQYGYEVDEAGTATLKMATDYIAQAFDCLSMTLEMPFKDTTDTALPLTGWSPDRCRLLGRACVDAIYAVVDKVRA